MSPISVAENKASFRRTYEEMFNQRNLAIADELIAPEFINHEAPPEMSRGPESMRGAVIMLTTAFPDLRFDVQELVGEDDTVIGRVVMSGTHQGAFQGIPPTGRSFRQDSIHIVRFNNGKAIDHRAVRDDLGMMQQLGVVPALAHGR